MNHCKIFIVQGDEILAQMKNVDVQMVNVNFEVGQTYVIQNFEVESSSGQCPNLPRDVTDAWGDNTFPMPNPSPHPPNPYFQNSLTSLFCFSNIFLK